ncbi:hypothetical protein DL98DRAFT_511093 [Cadophora sp. DSE1049]|nr:hypothetical protein DL98DRAFT_511093 [Cadophora sp. DSE1049]
MSNLSLRRNLLGCLWCYHTVLILSPEHGSTICLDPDLLNQDLFVWSPYTISFISVMFVAAPIRLLAYTQLGENFTFQLAKPTKLVKTGMYRYVQHPSYAPLFLMTSAVCFFMMRLDGVAACVLPSALVRVQWLGIAGGIATPIIAFASMTVRVRDEEQMLQKEFGEEWEAYHRQTRRFIPGVF